MPAKTKQQTKPEGRDTSKRPELSGSAKQAFQKMKERAQNPMFFTWEQDDQAVVQILRRTLANTVNGENPLYTAYYQSGNIHDTGAGAPEDIGKDFRFWSTTVLETQFQELDVRPGDSVAIMCLGDREGKHRTYKDFAVEVVGRSNTPALKDGAITPEIEAPKED